MAACDTADSDSCRNDAAALSLKFAAIASILLAGVSGVAIPLVLKNRRLLRTDGDLFVGAKAFAAGVILATGLVHMLPGGSAAMNNPCLPEFPWSTFPFSGFFTIRGGLGTILELGIVLHSVIIGLSLGVSQSPCTIRPLVAALSFHQFFEGFALGGCISQAQFRDRSVAIMACFFAITTPLGIGIGIGVSSIYDPNSPGALVTEGILDSMSAGILVYMALVDLIAANFLSKRMSCNFRLQIVSYCSLFLGAGMMFLLAIWA